MSIKILPPHLANQIAAGEVIERPASVLKECLENAIDAKATDIVIEVERGGMERICIRDNGIGVEKSELPLMIAPHATSKIRTVKDLSHIQTLGFRGEALASISAVSRMTIASKTKEAPHAYALSVEGGSTPKISATAHPVGTTIDVKALFYNVPVRRTFLKSEKAEFLKIESTCKRLAFSHFEIGISLFHNGRLVFKLPKALTDAEREKRIIKLFGKVFFEKAIPINAAFDKLSLKGYLGSPDFMRSQSDLQYMYINSRMVRDKLVNHAIKQVYQPLLYPGRVPSFLLFLKLSPEDFDVNVHPTKHEVRFRKAREVHDFIVSEVAHVLRGEEVNELCEAVSPSASSPTKRAAHHYESASHETVEDTNGVLLSIGGTLGLISDGEKVYIFDYKTLYSNYIEETLSATLKNSHIESRPLLVPATVTLSEALVNHFPYEIAKKLGFDISPIDVDKLLVRAFPVATPYIDFKTCVSGLSSIQTVDEGMRVVSQSQRISFSILRGEMRSLLFHLLSRHKEIHRYGFKQITSRDWATLHNG